MQVIPKKTTTSMATQSVAAHLSELCNPQLESCSDHHHCGTCKAGAAAGTAGADGSVGAAGAGCSYPGQCRAGRGSCNCEEMYSQ